jgi:hypothetical protein
MNEYACFSITRQVWSRGDPTRRIHGIWIDREKEALTAGADPRRVAYALAWQPGGLLQEQGAGE